jgi:hypothetical protein
MSANTYICRLLGGRNVGVAYDPVANTLAILNQSLSLAGVPATLVTNLQTAVGNAPNTRGANGAFGGDNIAQAVGAILDAMPTWRSQVQAALASHVSGLGGIGSAGAGQQISDPETWVR